MVTCGHVHPSTSSATTRARALFPLLYVTATTTAEIGRTRAIALRNVSVLVLLPRVVLLFEGGHLPSCLESE